MVMFYILSLAPGCECWVVEKPLAGSPCGLVDGAEATVSRSGIEGSFVEKAEKVLIAA
jgi:hypothetical protein